MSAPRRVARLLVLGALVATLPACLGEDGGDAEYVDAGGFGGEGGFGGGGGADIGDDDCAHGCQWLDDCGLCWPDVSSQACLDIAGCAEQCRDQGDAPVAACVVELSSCDDDAGIDGCFDAPSQPDPMDDCAAGCAALDACDLCDPDETGACLELSACAAACRAGGGAAGGGAARGRCLAAVVACDPDALGACGEATPPPPEDDVCARGCAALDTCGFCERDADDECVSIEVCAQACRDEGTDLTYQCLIDLNDCDDASIGGCYGDEDPGDDVCAQGCVALEACDLCLTDDADVCLSVVDCAQSCRDDGTEAMAMCVAAVEACDQASLDACFE